MEKEYKWSADEILLNQALLWASSRIGAQIRHFRMESQYYDTVDGLLASQKSALRLRRENDKSICCMKLRNVNTPEGMRAHEEYECEASSIKEGLGLLPGCGAPKDLCTKASDAELQVICEVSFDRCAVMLQEENTVCELALDKGELCHNGRSAPLCEIEMEFIAGSEDVFHKLAAELSSYLSLSPEPLSKLERARAL